MSAKRPGRQARHTALLVAAAFAAALLLVETRMRASSAGVFADAGWQEFEQEPHPEPGQLEQGLAQGESSVLAAAAAAAAAATAAQRAAAARSRASGAAAPAIRTSCSRLLWMTGLQAETADGSEAHYIASSSSYMRYYAAALASARERAPSLLPVLVVLNGMSQAFVDWVEAQGALVVRHELSFGARMAASREPNDPRVAERNNIMASYARLDVPAIVPKVEQLLRRRRAADHDHAAAAALSVDTDFVLWTDPDVLFKRDVNNCSLPAPPVLSIGPEFAPGTVINCGVMYYNVRAWAATLPAVLDYADSQEWQFLHDQELVYRFFRDAGVEQRQPYHVLTALPNGYNYKAYWGVPQKGWLGLFEDQFEDVAIVHTHGPKPEMSLCVIDYLAQHVEDRLRFRPQQVLESKAKLIQLCQIDPGAAFLNEIMEIMAGGFKMDGGEMYRWVVSEQQRLCPGLCWLGGDQQQQAGAAAGGGTQTAQQQQQQRRQQGTTALAGGQQQHAGQRLLKHGAWRERR